MRSFKRVIALLIMVMLIASIIPAAVMAKSQVPTKIKVEGAEVYAECAASKVNGNKNILTITITDASGKTTKEFWINNNADGVYSITTEEGDYTVYVATYGNVKIDSFYFVSFEQNATLAGEELEGYVNLGFIGYYPYGDMILSTSFYWQKVEAGSHIIWEDVYAAYADWQARGGLGLPENLKWRTSGINPLYFDADALVSCEDFTLAQQENYYKSFYVDGGYAEPTVTPAGEEGTSFAYQRYTAYVYVWNLVYNDPTTSEATRQILRDNGGSTHYQALVAYYGYDVVMGTKFEVVYEENMDDVFDYWSNLFQDGIEHLTTEGQHFEGWTLLGLIEEFKEMVYGK